MSMTRNSRHALLAIALLITVAAAVFSPDESAPDGSEPVIALVKSTRQGSLAQAAIAAAPTLDPWQLSERSDLSTPPLDLFYQENPEQKAAELAQKEESRRVATAPILPYQYMGQQDQHGRLTVFLMREDKPQVVAQGDVLDGFYRVDFIKPDHMQFTYLPLGEKQVLNFGNRS